MVNLDISTSDFVSENHIFKQDIANYIIDLRSRNDLFYDILA